MRAGPRSARTRGATRLTRISMVPMDTRSVDRSFTVAALSGGFTSKGRPGRLTYGTIAMLAVVRVGMRTS
jgi:hypothetical protein